LAGGRTDVLGVGFGPSNLALAIAAREREEAGLSVPEISFVDGKPKFAWQPGMLLPGARMQSCFLEDLVTYRDPSSRYSFLMYLHAKGRLYEYVNLRHFYPTRSEFNDYLEWASAQVADRVRYGVSVLAVEPDWSSGIIDAFRVVMRANRTGAVTEERYGSIVLASGGAPRTPDNVAASSGRRRIIHSHYFLEQFPDRFIDRNAPYRFLVVGAGQSAAEILFYLHRQYPKATISGVLRNFSFRPMDDTCFFNEIFHPARVDFIYDFPHESRSLLETAYHRGNYASVSPDLITALYQALYEDRVAGVARVQLLAFSEVLEMREESAVVEARLRDLASTQTRTESYDAVLLCTGYRRNTPHPLLESLAPYLRLNDTGGYDMTRRYRVRTTDAMTARVYLQGWSELSHGLGDSLLPVLPVRSAEILDALSEKVTATDQRGERPLAFTDRSVVRVG
jgi:L-ornithine N5-oxygenase